MERRATLDAQRRVEECEALQDATDPREIAERLTAAANSAYLSPRNTTRGSDFDAPTRAAWATLVRSGALRSADVDVVGMKFHKPFIGRATVAEMWRRPAWGGAYDGCRWWLAMDGSLWREKPKSYSSTPWDMVFYSKLESTFAVPRNHPSQVRTSVNQSLTGARMRYWGVAGGTLLENWTNARDFVNIVAEIVSVALR